LITVQEKSGIYKLKKTINDWSNQTWFIFINSG
jgi:hypothetical protein